MVKIEEMAQSRSNMYKFFFSTFLEPPSEGFIGRLTDSTFLEELGDLFGREISFDLGKAGNDSSYRLTELRQDFMDLFKVPLGSYVTPFEAVYRDEREVGEKKVRGLMMGPSTLKVQSMYGRAGAGLDKAGYKELPDHISTELAFMSFLCTREYQAWKKGREGEAKDALNLEKEFMDEHLSKWVPLLCENIRKNTKTSFYGGLATLLENFLRIESEYLTGTLS